MEAERNGDCYNVDEDGILDEHVDCARCDDGMHWRGLTELKCDFSERRLTIWKPEITVACMLECVWEIR